MPAQTQSLPELIRQFDFGEGIVGGRSDLGIPTMGRRLGRRAYIRHVRLADNAIFRPARAIRVRPGSRDISSAAVASAPQSLGKFYNASGNRVFVHAVTGLGTGALYEAQSAAYATQTAPYSLTDQNLVFEMLNGVLIATQVGGSQAPFFYYQGAGATWLTTVLPAPSAAVTFAADSIGGNLTTAVAYYYRVRWRYTNGSSLAGPVSAAHTPMAPNLTVNINANLTPGSPRADYLGWTLERTKQGGDATGPFYTVNDGTAATYADAAADAALFTLTRDTNHGSPVHVDGIVAHRSRLWGWEGSNLHMSQTIGDPTEATGIFNWIGDNIYLVAKDDGDAIVRCIVQGDRLVIFKRRSIWALEGDAPESFRLRHIYDGAGACGPRAVCATGATLWFDSGDGGLFEMRGDRVMPIGWTQIGHYLDARDLSRQSSGLVTNYLGEYIIFWYSAQSGATNGDQLVFDLRFGVWSHFGSATVGTTVYGWIARDALVQKDELDFNRATLLFCDPTRARANITITSSNNKARIVTPQGTIDMTLATGNPTPIALAQDLQAKTRTAYNVLVASHNGWYVNYGLQILTGFNDLLRVLYGAFTATVTIPAATYDGPGLAAAAQTVLNTLPGLFYPGASDRFAVTYSAGNFTIVLVGNQGHTFGLVGAGVSPFISAAPTMGFLPVTQTAGLSQTSDFSVGPDLFSICWKGQPSGTYGATFKFSDATNFTSAATLGYALVDVGPAPGSFAVAGSVTGYGYHVWAGFTGTVDRAAVDGSGGLPIRFMFESPKIDEGTPNQFKDFERLEAYIESVGASLTATLDFDGDAPSVAVALQVAGGGAQWDNGNGTFDGPPEFLWNDGTRWPSNQRATETQGLPYGSIARRYSVRFRADLANDCVVPGYVVNALLMPEYRYS